MAYYREKGLLDPMRVHPLFGSLTQQIVLAVGLIGIIGAIVGILCCFDPSLLHLFDNLHWTFATLSAAILATLGYRHTPHIAKRWFSIGLIAYALGQIVWDIQDGIDYSPFPAPADLLYILLGPAFAIGMWHEVRARARSIFWLDVILFMLVGMIFILAWYLPKGGDITPWAMGIMVFYPLSLLLPLVMLLLMIPTLRLRLTLPLVGMILALGSTMVSWMVWNALALDGRTIDGSPLNLSFSLGILILGMMSAQWQLPPDEESPLDRIHETLLRLIPLLGILLIGVSIITVGTSTAPWVQILIYVGGSSVVVLAMIRQSHLIHERDTLLALQGELLQTTSLLQSIIQGAPLRIFWKDRDLRYLGCNDLFAHDAGYTDATEMIGLDDHAMSWHEQADLYRADDRSVMENAQPILGYEEPQSTPSGELIWLRTSKIPLQDPKTHQIIGILGMYDDITPSKQITTALRQKELYQQALLDNFPFLVWLKDDEGRFLAVNHPFALATGKHTIDAVIGKTDLDVWPDDLARAYRADDAEILRTLTPKETEELITQEDGSRKWFETYKAPVIDADGRVLGTVGFARDISQRKQMEEQLHYIAHYDTLTHLPNRLLFSTQLSHCMHEIDHPAVVLLYLDLDGFKEINDHYGHAMGDKLLIEISQRLQSALPTQSLLSRFGGDEFVVLIHQEIDTIDPLLQELLTCAAHPITLDGYRLKVSASIGVTFYPQSEPIDADQLIRQADQAMYHAKQTGKNRYHLFNPAHDRALRLQHESIDRLQRALAEGEFLLYYQPKVHMRTGALLGVEALIRWDHPQRGILAPYAFLPDILDHPLSIDVGYWVIERALEQAWEWYRSYTLIPISVNLDAMLLQHCDFIPTLTHLMDRYRDLPHNTLEFEILETGNLNDMSTVATILTQCKTLGIACALDDFGTGYSSLSYLKRLPTSTIKIDQSFIHHLLDDPEDLAIVEGVLELADTFHRDVIAEGVEEIAQGVMLLLMGCEHAQGYIIARPRPAEALLQWHQEWTPPQQWQSLPPYCEEHRSFAYLLVGYRAWIEEVRHGRDAHTPKLLLWLHQHPCEETAILLTLHQRIVSVLDEDTPLQHAREAFCEAFIRSIHTLPRS